MFELNSKAKPSSSLATAKVEAMPPTPKTRTGTAKNYIIGMVTPSQRLLRRHMTQTTRTPPATPENKIISAPTTASLSSISALTPDQGPCSPLIIHKKSARSVKSNTSQDRGYPMTPMNSELTSPITPSAPRNESEAECVFCSVGLSRNMESEPVHKLKCDHYSHDWCLYRLNGSVKEIGDYDVLCPMCESPAARKPKPKCSESGITFGAALDFAPGFKPGISTPMSSGPLVAQNLSRRSLGPLTTSESVSTDVTYGQGSVEQGPFSASRFHRNDSAPISGLRSPILEGLERSNSLLPPMTFPAQAESDSTSISTGRVTLWSTQSRTDGQSSARPSTAGSNITEVDPAVSEPSSPLSSEVDEPWTGFSVCREFKSLLKSDHAFTVVCSPRMQPFRIMTTTDQKEQGTTRVLVTIQSEPAPAHRDLLSGYRFSARDIQHSIRARENLAAMKFEFKDLALAEMTTLRLHSQTSVTSPDSRSLNWKECDAYLFEDLIVITRNSTVSATVTLKQSKARAYVNYSRPDTVELKFANPDLIDLNLHVSSPAIALMWQRAFEDPRAHFPLAPGKAFNNHVACLNEQLNAAMPAKVEPFLAAEIILCLPVNSRYQALVMQQAVREAVASLAYRDKLGLIVFSKQRILRTVGFTAPHSKVWEDVLDGIHEKASQTAPCSFSLDLILNAAYQLLARRQAFNATASIILLSDNDMQLQSLSSSFAHSRVPVHTIGISEHHNVLSLSMVAQHSAGSYYYVRSNEELHSLVGTIVKQESHYSHKNVTLRFKPRIRTSISGSSGGSPAPSVESMFGVMTRDQTLPADTIIDDGSGVLVWNVGAMRMGDIRNLIVDVKGHVPPGSNILQVTLEATQALSPDDTACSSVFRVAVPTAEESTDPRLTSLVVAFGATQAALCTLQQAIKKMLQDEGRSAYDQLLSELQRLQSTQNAGLVTSKPAIAMLEAYQWLFDYCCDDIVKNSQRTQQFMLELLQRVWAGCSLRSLLKRDPIERTVYDN